MTDTHAATELKLYIDNDGDLYRRQTTSILKSLATKKTRGEYKHDLAVKAFGYLVEAGAKKYANEFEPNRRVWHQMFDAPTRKAVAEELAKDFEGEFALGNYDQLLPKKYQKPSKATASHHARKAKTMDDYEAEGYKARTWYVADCPYSQPKIRDAWQRGAWKWQQEQRALRPSKAVAAHATMRHSITAKDIREFNGFLRNASDRQVQGIYDKESRAGRDEYAELAIAEAARRGIEIDTGTGYDHARRKSPSQLDREIKHALSGHGGR
jgi:hypothetical protein